ncbi:MAG: hypothetical protein R3E98_04285 [Gemmatimonadota bacterium]
MRMKTIGIAFALWAQSAPAKGQEVTREPVWPDAEELVERFVEGHRDARMAPAWAISACPDSPWHRELLERLLNVQDRNAVARMAADWAGGAVSCLSAMLVPWYEERLRSADTPELADLLARGYVQHDVLPEAAALRAAGLQGGAPAAVRSELLQRLHFRLPGADQVDLYLAAMASGGMPHGYAGYARLVLLGGDHRDAFVRAVTPAALADLSRPEAEATLWAVIQELEYWSEADDRGLSLSTRRAAVRELSSAADAGRLRPEMAAAVGKLRPIG